MFIACYIYIQVVDGRSLALPHLVFSTSGVTRSCFLFSFTRHRSLWNTACQVALRATWLCLEQSWVCACNSRVKNLMTTSALSPFQSRGLVGPLPFWFFKGLHFKICLLKTDLWKKAKQQRLFLPPKATSIGYCQSLSRFYVKLPIHAVSIDQTTKCLFIFFSIQLEFLWLSDSSFISVSECPVLNG